MEATPEYLEYEKANKELEALTAPLKKKIRELRKVIDDQYFAKQQKMFDDIKGKLYYGDKNTWNGFSNSNDIYLIKPISVASLEMYSTCNVLEFHICYDKKGDY